jgi:hypothetical protein
MRTFIVSLKIRIVVIRTRMEKMKVQMGSMMI